MTCGSSRRSQRECRWLGAANGWNVQFGRELNATDDSAAFVPFTGSAARAPVLEGKQIEPFRVSTATCRHELADERRRHASAAPRPSRLPRHRERDQSPHADRGDRPAARGHDPHAVLPENAAPADAQHVSCALLNSFVANYLVRLRVNTHVTVALVSRLPVPVSSRDGPVVRHARVACLAALAAGDRPVEEMTEYAELQALVARLYGLTRKSSSIPGTFPLIAIETREELMNFAAARYHTTARDCACHGDTEAPRHRGFMTMTRFIDPSRSLVALSRCIGTSGQVCSNPRMNERLCIELEAAQPAVRASSAGACSLQRAR